MCGFKMGSDVYGLPSQETYLDSQDIHLDDAKIGTFFLTSKFFRAFFILKYTRAALCRRAF